MSIASFLTVLCMLIQSTLGLLLARASHLVVPKAGIGEWIGALRFDNQLVWILIIQQCVLSKPVHYWLCNCLMQIQARNSGSAWDQEVPEVHRALDQEAAFPEVGSWDCPGLQDWPEVPIKCCACSPRGSWGLLGWSVWGHQLGSHSCQEGDHHAQGHPACSPHQRRESLKSCTTTNNTWWS